MNIVHIVALLAVCQFIMFGLMVGQAREKFGVKAPAITGHEEFERVFRVQMNTLEQLICFLPALLIAAAYWPQIYVAAAGVVYLIGRFVYARSYVKNPSTRGLGFMLTFFPTVVLILAGLAGAVLR
jgi:glutathione S-transferase